MKEYLDRSEKYFKLGESVNIITDNANIDFTTVENQQKLVTFNAKMKSCDGCKKDWTIEESFDSWYETFTATIVQQPLASTTACRDAWDSSNSVVVPIKFAGCLQEFLSQP